MLNITKEWKGDALAVSLIGIIDDTVDLERLIGPPPAILHVNTKEVSNITSHGIRHWIHYFTNLAAAGTRVLHLACSPPIVEQINMIRNFVADPSTIMSISLPYLCTSCKKQFVAVVSIASLQKRKGQMPRLTCSKCGKPTTEFDDIESEYLGFLNRLSQPLS